ncbi:MAG: XRE family transcriptional regulator [Thermodesulfobacteriota bacterium]
MKAHTRKINKKGDFIDELTSMISPERSKRAQKEAEKEIFQIRLSEIRKRMGIRQEDIRSFSQSGISKLESRKDMKISTLVDYLNNIGLGLEIKVYPKDHKRKGGKEITLLIA